MKKDKNQKNDEKIDLMLNNFFKIECENQCFDFEKFKHLTDYKKDCIIPLPNNRKTYILKKSIRIASLIAVIMIFTFLISTLTNESHENQLHKNNFDYAYHKHKNLIKHNNIINSAINKNKHKLIDYKIKKPSFLDQPNNMYINGKLIGTYCIIHIEKADNFIILINSNIVLNKKNVNRNNLYHLDLIIRIDVNNHEQKNCHHENIKINRIPNEICNCSEHTYLIYSNSNTENAEKIIDRMKDEKFCIWC